MSPEIKEKIVEKIQKLLRLSKSTNEHEASLAASHVHRLLAEHNLSMTDCEVAEKESADQRHVSIGKKPALWCVTLIKAVGEAFDCYNFTAPKRGTVTFVGIGADVEIASYTFEYLHKVVTQLGQKFYDAAYLAAVANGTQLLTATKRREEKFNYMRGVAYGIRDSLRKEQQEHPVNTTALVIVKEALIKQTVAKEYPGIKSVTHMSTIQKNEVALALGYRDGQQVQLRQGVAGTNSSQLAA